MVNATYDDSVLLSAARTFARNKSYSPYSHFRVGAVIITPDDTHLFRGANVEHSTFSGTLCGERSAIVEAVTHGFALNDPQFIQSITVSCVDALDNFTTADRSPCGACRQVLREFASPEMPVIIDDGMGGVRFKLSDLLPNGFSFDPVYVPLAPRNRSVDITDIERASLNYFGHKSDLLHLAEAASVNAYVPYSGIHSAAIALTTNGRAFAGVAVENSSYGLSIDAMHAAINRAVLGTPKMAFETLKNEGRGLIRRISVFRDTAASAELLPLINTGILAEFADANTIIDLISGGKPRTFMFSQLASLGI
jgi:cytidine deaminase